jgi:hypothetical protein
VLLHGGDADVQRLLAHLGGHVGVLDQRVAGLACHERVCRKTGVCVASAARDHPFATACWPSCSLVLQARTAQQQQHPHKHLAVERLHVDALAAVALARRCCSCC